MYVNAIRPIVAACRRGTANFDVVTLAVEGIHR